MPSHIYFRHLGFILAPEIPIFVGIWLFSHVSQKLEAAILDLASAIDLWPLIVFPVPKIPIFGVIWLFSHVFQKLEAAILGFKMASPIDFWPLKVILVPKIPIFGGIWLFFMFSRNRKPPSIKIQLRPTSIFGIWSSSNHGIWLFSMFARN